MGKPTSAELLEEASEVDVAACEGPCHRVLPLTAGHFHRDPTTDTGFNRLCKTCRSEQRRVEKAKDVLESLKKLEERGLSVMEQESDLNVGGLPHIATTFEEILKLFGGATGFAQHVFAQYLLSPAGQPGRTKLLSKLLDLNMKLSDAGHASKPTEEMTDDQLAENLQKALNKITKTKIHDVP